MQQQIKINALRGWSQLIENVLKSIANSNEHGLKMSIDGFEAYIRAYNSKLPVGIFNYTTKQPDINTLEVYIDEDLALSFTLIELYDLKTNSNY